MHRLLPDSRASSLMLCGHALLLVFYMLQAHPSCQFCLELVTSSHLSTSEKLFMHHVEENYKLLAIQAQLLSTFMSLLIFRSQSQTFNRHYSRSFAHGECGQACQAPLWSCALTVYCSFAFCLWTAHQEKHWSTLLVRTPDNLALDNTHHIRRDNGTHVASNEEARCMDCWQPCHHS